MKTISVMFLFFVASAAASCTTEQVYGTAQAWQRNQCTQLPDKGEVDRCMDKASATYDSYQKQSGPANK